MSQNPASQVNKRGRSQDDAIKTTMTSQTGCWKYVYGNVWTWITEKQVFANINQAELSLYFHTSTDYVSLELNSYYVESSLLDYVIF